ncbi:MAG TPA: hypothetical protein VH684_29175 [Xanthobacteraceae bacterium]|jgi:hypothetical protein
MQTYVATIGGKAVLAFRAEDDEQARDVVDGDSLRSDLRVLTTEEGKPLWDGRSAIGLREASRAEHDEWEKSRDEAIRDGEIDLDAGHDPNDWDIYFIEIPGAGRGRRAPQGR